MLAFKSYDAMRLHVQIVDKVDEQRIFEAVEVISEDNPSEVEARSILRRMVADFDTPLFMWDSMSYWQTHNSQGKPKRVMVRDSGW